MIAFLKTNSFKTPFFFDHNGHVDRILLYDREDIPLKVLPLEDEN